MVSPCPLPRIAHLIFIATPFDVLGLEPNFEVLREGCFRYFELGGECVGGPVGLLSAYVPLCTHHGPCQLTESLPPQSYAKTLDTVLPLFRRGILLDLHPFNEWTSDSNRCTELYTRHLGDPGSSRIFR